MFGQCTQPILLYLKKKKKKQQKKTKPKLQSLASLYCIIISRSFYLRDEIRVLQHDSKHICWDMSEFIFAHTFSPTACPTVDPAVVLT